LIRENNMLITCILFYTYRTYPYAHNSETIVHITVKFQFNHCCIQGVEVSTNSGKVA